MPMPVKADASEVVLPKHSRLRPAVRRPLGKAGCGRSSGAALEYSGLAGRSRSFAPAINTQLTLCLSTTTKRLRCLMTYPPFFPGRVSDTNGDVRGDVQTGCVGGATVAIMLDIIARTVCHVKTLMFGMAMCLSTTLLVSNKPWEQGGRPCFH